MNSFSAAKRAKATAKQRASVERKVVTAIPTVKNRSGMVFVSSTKKDLPGVKPVIRIK